MLDCTDGSREAVTVRVRCTVAVASVSRVREEPKSLNDRLVKVEAIVIDIDHDNAAGSPDTKFVLNPNDQSLRRISILDIEIVDTDVRIPAIEGWMTK